MTDEPLDSDYVRGRGYYTLDAEHRIIEATSLRAWARWFEDTTNRVVKQENLGAYFVSTVFLGLDHRFGRGGRPLLFETMVFQRRGHEENLNIQERCSTWQEAEAQHARVAAEIKKAGAN